MSNINSASACSRVTHLCLSETIVIADADGVIYAVVANGMPNKPSYQAALGRAFHLISTWGENAKFPLSETYHRHGNFPAVDFGISLGPGGQVPMRRAVGGHNAMVEEFLESLDIQDISNYMDCKPRPSLSAHPCVNCQSSIAVFATWAPKMHEKYRKCLQAVEDATGVSRNYPGSVFASATANFGPKVRSFIHRNMLNQAGGRCEITLLGNFNHKIGGKLVLWEAKLIVEVASGATAFIPSATLTHSNTAISESEERASFTQFTGGSLFRWVDNGFKTDVKVKSGNPAEYRHIFCKTSGTI